MTPRIGHRVIRLDEAPSTIDVARSLAREGAEHGTVILADRQTAGRGRRGRMWTTLPGKSLAMTVILRELPQPDRLGLAGMSAALAVVHAARKILGGELRTKWPNDVVADGKKLGGTLAETCGDALLLSIGLNINGSEDDLPEEIRGTATTLEMVAGAPIDRERMTEQVIAEMDECWQVLLRVPEELMREWEQADVTKGAEVVVEEGDGTRIEGRAMGVDEGGRLVLRTADGVMEVVSAGDVTVGPVDEGGQSSIAETPDSRHG